MEWEIIIIITLLVAGGYFAFKYYSLCYALKKVGQACDGLRDDITQNQMLHLPFPNKELSYLLYSFNLVLEDIQLERQKYDKREKEFQKQIENISHDLRTPLTVIYGYINLIKKNHSLSEELSEEIEIIGQRIVVMTNLLAEFYEYSLLNAGKYELIIERVDVVKILRETLMGHHHILEKANLEIEVDIPSSAIFILGNTMALERIFTNLFQNASKYSSSVLQIAIKNEKNSVSVLFTNDTNKLSENEIPHIFDRFYTQDNSRNQSGTGLGLTIAKSLADEMGAELNAYISDTGKNSEEMLKICFELNIST